MEQKLTHDYTLELQDVVEIDGDLLLLPEQMPLPLEEARALEVSGLAEAKTSSIYRGVYDLIRLGCEYRADRAHLGKEPEWVNEYPMSVRTHLRFTYAVTEEDPLAIVPRFSHTGLSYMVREDGFSREVCDVFKLWRLQHIKQLGFLNAPTYNSFTRLRQSLSESSRFLHSLDVGTIATLMGVNAGLNERHLRSLRLLGLAHDAFTVAGGDSIKIVSPNELDEDLIFEQKLGGMNMRRLVSEFGVLESVLREGIHNRGLIGEMLDIADKLAYIARDVDKCLHHIEAGAYQDHLGLRSLVALLKKYPYVCSIWDAVEVQDGHAVFTNIPRLVAFLKVRLLMFRELYYHPDTRFGEFLMSRLFVRVLYKQKKLTKDLLLEMTDGDLLEVLDSEFGSGTALDTCSSEFSRCNTFRTPEEAQNFVQKIQGQGHVFWMLDDNRRNIKPGTDFLVKGRTGPITLRNADSGSARELEEMSMVLPMVHVYWLEGDPALPRKSLAMLKTVLV